MRTKQREAETRRKTDGTIANTFTDVLLHCFVHTKAICHHTQTTHKQTYFSTSIPNKESAFVFFLPSICCCAKKEAATIVLLATHYSAHTKVHGDGSDCGASIQLLFIQFAAVFSNYLSALQWLPSSAHLTPIWSFYFFRQWCAVLLGLRCRQYDKHHHHWPPSFTINLRPNIWTYLFLQLITFF